MSHITKQNRPDELPSQPAWLPSASAAPTTTKNGVPSSGLGPSVLPESFCAFLAHLTPKEIKEIERAYSFSIAAHAGQVRQSGEPYVSHPFQVAGIIAELKLDTPTIIAALLHDVLEDTSIRHAQIKNEFGQQVASIVDGVSRIDILDSQQRKMSQAESFQKMLLAMSNDLRVIIVKLADRLHNMRTLQYKSLRKRKIIAQETLDIYAPIAQHLGIDQIRRELEDLGFSYLFPWRHRILASKLTRQKEKYKQELEVISGNIKERLDAHGIDCKITRRHKDIFSVFCKMREKHLLLSQVMDIFAIRINTSDVDQCYRILGLVHNLYQPKPGLFKDYIAIPKPNGYQSLHTVLFIPHGPPLEIQIRTHEMHWVAERGVAAHHSYKNQGSVFSPSNNEYARASEWVQSLIDLHSGDTTEEFMENFKSSLFSSEVYVFTPQGKIISLPRNATVLDFAFAVHTDVGLHCVAAKVNHGNAPLDQKLRNGQTVQIVNGEVPHVTATWLNFVATSKARSAIRQHLKHLRSEAAASLGQALLDQALKQYKTSLNEIEVARYEPLLKELHLSSTAELFHQVGLGEQIPVLLAQRLVHGSASIAAQAEHLEHLAIKGTEGVIVAYGKCCYPIPGDDIIGVMNPGKGLVVHRSNCANIHRAKSDRSAQFLLEWATPPQQGMENLAAIRVTVQHKRGMLAKVSDHIAQVGSNIETISVAHKGDGWVEMNFVLSVADRQHLAQVMRRIRSLSQRINVVRK